MVLTPEGEEGIQGRILAAIARCMILTDISDKLMAAEDPRELFLLLKSALQGAKR